MKTSWQRVSSFKHLYRKGSIYIIYRYMPYGTPTDYNLKQPRISGTVWVNLLEGRIRYTVTELTNPDISPQTVTGMK